MMNKSIVELKYGSKMEATHIPKHEETQEAAGLTGHELQELAKMVKDDIMDMVVAEERRVEKRVIGAAKHLGYEEEGRVFFAEMERGLHVLEGNTISRIERILK